MVGGRLKAKAGQVRFHYQRAATLRDMSININKATTMTIKTIAVMKSGATMILRLNDSQMAHFVSEFRKAVKYGIESWDSYAGRVINYDQIKRVKFINEYTRECLLEY